MTTPTTYAPTIESWKHNEKSGAMVPILDVVAQAAVNGGYDALRLRTLGLADNDVEEATDAEAALAPVRPVAVSVARMLLKEAVKQAELAKSDHAHWSHYNGALRSALRARRVGRSKPLLG